MQHREVQKMRLKLYFAHGANCSDRVRWALAYKSVPFEGIDIDTIPGDATFRSISPFGRVPVLVTDRDVLTESMAIVEYIEDIHPEPSLMSEQPQERARIREICEVVNSSIHPVQNSSALRSIRPDWTKETMRPFRSHWIASNLEKLRPKLWCSSSYAVGNRFTLADIFVAVIYRKAVELSDRDPEAGPYRSHWEFLMSQPAIAASCPD
jgi:maleylacetoacetate isomerase